MEPHPIGLLGCVTPVVGYPGHSGTQPFSLTAPTKPGTYYLRHSVLADFQCRYGGGEDIGLIIVVP
jgi:hypothetical protein